MVSKRISKSTRGEVLAGFSSLLLFAAAAWAAGPNWVYLKGKGELRSPETAQVSFQAAQRRIASDIKQAANYADLSLHPRYIRMLEVSGLRIRARSRWLNAVSVEGELQTEELMSKAYVRFVEPVAIQQVSYDNSVNLIQRKDPIEPEFFGNTYNQLQLLNIPAVHNIGIFGQGVRIGFLDTGLKRDHPVFKTLRLGAEHDFITGDDIMLWDGTSQSYSPVVSGFEMIIQPEVYEEWMFFIADSLRANQSSLRVLYGVPRNGSAWDKPQPLSTNQNVVVRSYAVGGDEDKILVWEQGEVSQYNPEQTRNLVWGSFTGETFQQASGILDSDSRNPFIFDCPDSSFLFYIKHDSILMMAIADRSTQDAVWSEPLEIHTTEGVLDQPEAFVSGDSILVVAVDLSQGILHCLQSTNMGDSFEEMTSPADAEVVAAALYHNHLITSELEPSSGGFRLHSYQTSDAGQSWTGFTHPETFEVIDRVDITSHNNLLQVAFSSAGRILMTSQTSQAVDAWNEPQQISDDWFSYKPQIGSIGGSVEVVWAERGDDDTDYDPNEDGIDGNENSHPAHGSRTAALAVGYQGRSYVGASPGAELYVAKTEKHVNYNGVTYELRVEEDIWIEGLEWLERQGVDIVNSSLGYGQWYDYEQRDGLHSPASRAATMASERGVLVINSAGNVYTESPYILPPGDAEGILTVGGVDTTGQWWAQGPESSSRSGSAVGPTADGRLKPELVAPGTGVYVINVDDSLSFGYYGNGTSYAAPLVAGIAALMLKVHPEYRGNPDTLISLLEQSASNWTSPNDTLGYGFPDAYQAILPLPADIDTFSANLLLAPFPNPFYPASQPRICFPFRLNKASPLMKMTVLTLSGERLVETELKPLVPNSVDEIPIGLYDDPDDLVQIGAFWDGLTANGQPAGSGLYLVVLHTQFGTHVAKFALLR